MINICFTLHSQNYVTIRFKLGQKKKCTMKSKLWMPVNALQITIDNS